MGGQTLCVCLTLVLVDRQCVCVCDTGVGGQCVCV